MIATRRLQNIFAHFLANFPPPQLKMPFFIFFLFIAIFLHLTSNCSSAESTCQIPQPLGMESGQIANWQLTASSTFDATMLGPANARIRKELGGGAWCPQRQIDSQSYEYIQVDLLAPYEIWAIELQGRYGNGTGREFAEAIMIDFLGPAQPRNWTRYGQMMDEDGENGNKNGTRGNEMEQNQQILPANRDERTPELIPLVPPLIASSIRLVPFSLQLRTVCLRFELFGCILPNENALELELIGAENTNSNGKDGNWTLAKWRQQIWQRPALLYPLAGLLSLLPLALFLLLLRHLARLHLQHCQKPSLFSCSTFSSRAPGNACFSGSNSSSSSQPLRRSNSWQNVHLPFPFETGIGALSSARIFSPSFCRFESVSMEFPSLGRKKEQKEDENEAVDGPQKQQNFGAIWNNGLGEDGINPKTVGMCRSRSMANGGDGIVNGRRHTMMGNRQQHQQQIQAQYYPKLPTILPSPPIPPPSIRTVQLVHSSSQPDSILTRPMIFPHSQLELAPKGKKPIPKPRSITPLNNIIITN